MIEEENKNHQKSNDPNDDVLEQKESQKQTKTET